MEKYDILREQYPKFISLEQLYRICQIAKRSALYLVRHKIIPAVDSGQRTWRYRIALSDVITYLKRREEVGSMIPCGAVNALPPKASFPHESSLEEPSPREPCSFSAALGRNRSRQDIAEYFSSLCSKYPDVLTSQDVSKITGLAHETVLRILRSGGMEALRADRKYIIPKPYFLLFVQSPRFIRISRGSMRFIEVLKGFEGWRKRKK